MKIIQSHSRNPERKILKIISCIAINYTSCQLHVYIYRRAMWPMGLLFFRCGGPLVLLVVFFRNEKLSNNGFDVVLFRWKANQINPNDVI